MPWRDTTGIYQWFEDSTGAAAARGLAMHTSTDPRMGLGWDLHGISIYIYIYQCLSLSNLSRTKTKILHWLHLIIWTISSRIFTLRSQWIPMIPTKKNDSRDCEIWVRQFSKFSKDGRQFWSGSIGFHGPAKWSALLPEQRLGQKASAQSNVWN